VGASKENAYQCRKKIEVMHTSNNRRKKWEKREMK